MPGEEILPNKAKRAKPATRAPKTAIGARLAAMEAQEAQDSRPRVDALNAAAPAAQEPLQGPLTEDQFNQQPLYDDLVRPGDADSSGDEEVQPEAMNRSDYYRSITYQERCLREEANWNEVVPAMFLAFMPCSKATFQWADPLLWNHDYNTPCICSTWQLKDVEIDVIDFAGELLCLK